MAKRRNLKKEKAQRNQAYARQFRKRPTNGRFFKKFRQGGKPSGQEEEEGQRRQLRWSRLIPHTLLQCNGYSPCYLREQIPAATTLCWRYLVLNCN